jgi:hypothetical protein
MALVPASKKGAKADLYWPLRKYIDANYGTEVAQQHDNALQAVNTLRDEVRECVVGAMYDVGVMYDMGVGSGCWLWMLSCVFSFRFCSGARWGWVGENVSLLSTTMCIGCKTTTQ